MHTVSYEVTTYVIAHNGSDVVHPAIVEPGTTLSTGQAELEEFTDKEAWKARLTELCYDTTNLEPPIALDLKPGEVPTPEQMEAIRAQLNIPTPPEAECKNCSAPIDVTPTPIAEPPTPPVQAP